MSLCPHCGNPLAGHLTLRIEIIQSWGGASLEEIAPGEFECSEEGDQESSDVTLTCDHCFNDIGFDLLMGDINTHRIKITEI